MGTGKKEPLILIFVSYYFQVLSDGVISLVAIYMKYYKYLPCKVTTKCNSKILTN